MRSMDLEDGMNKIQENSFTKGIQQYLIDEKQQMEQLREDNLQLKAALRQAELMLSTMVREKGCQQAALSEQICSVDQLTLERQKRSAELGVQRLQIRQLKEGQDAFEKLEQENVKLKTHLKTVRAELNQASCCWRRQEAAHAHGLKVAVEMQKQITAKREQIDFMQSRIQLLEETIERLKMEKHSQAALLEKNAADLLSERESRRRLQSELKRLGLKERELQDKSQRLEGALQKMSKNFADCQDLIQKQEQGMTRLKLQHTLDLKEMQNQKWRSTVCSRCRKIPRDLPLGRYKANGLMEAGQLSEQRECAGANAPLEPFQMSICDPTVESKNLLGELPAGIDKGLNSHTARTVKKRSEEDQWSRHDYTRKVDPHLPDLNNTSTSHNNRFVTAVEMCPSLAVGRKSPVHLLLTSDLPQNRNKMKHLDNTQLI
ncbi:hypothetical protein DNTS_021415, partial [Danionella cerebrum]